MKHPIEQIEIINKLLDILDEAHSSGKLKINSYEHYDALQAIRTVLGRPSQWTNLNSRTALKRRLKKNSFVI